MAKSHHQSQKFLPAYDCLLSSSSKISACLRPAWALLAFITIFVFIQIPSLYSATRFQALFHVSSSLSFPQRLEGNGDAGARCGNLSTKLRTSVTFLPLKDVRFSARPMAGHTWFMSSFYDTHEQGEVQYQEFPSESSQGRLLCLRGNDSHDGSWNYYALAWPDSLPASSKFMKGLTFISYNHYDYANIWHGLSSAVPFVAWSLRNQCAVPERWVLYHWGEVRMKMALWLRKAMEATFGNDPSIEGFRDTGNEESMCFERAVVMRHNEGGMSRERRMEVYDLLRCRARSYCNISNDVTFERLEARIGMTLLMRTGARSFKNETAVEQIFEKECGRISGCSLTVAQSGNLSFCDQVKLMSKTDILLSPHGAQMTNLIFMERNSSVMEFFPKGWLKLAGVGQHVFRWLSSWSGMIHEGVWRDPQGEHCDYPEDDRRCMAVYKNGRIGQNETLFAQWARRVLDSTRARKIQEADMLKNSDRLASTDCSC